MPIVASTGSAAAAAKALSSVAHRPAASWITASAGSMAKTASGSSRRTSTVAKPTAAAVSRPTGSPITLLGSSSGQTSSTASRCSAFVMTNTSSTGTRSAKRSIVCASIAFSPTIGSNCLGRAVRLSGQKRSPRPPAMMTTYRLDILLRISSGGKMASFEFVS